MWLWQRIENIKCADKVGNGEVLRRADEEREIMKIIRKRKGSWIEHILRTEYLQRKILRGRKMLKEEEEGEGLGCWMI